MPEVRITIGGRQFEVACQDGEETCLLYTSDAADE